MSLEITQQRQQKDQFFRDHKHSPIPAEERKNFTGLKYYAYNPDLVFEIEPEEFADKEPVEMQTSTGDIRNYLRWGRVHFSVNGEPATLTLYFSPDHEIFFLPFMDATSGGETYGAGRYLDPQIDADGMIVLDFNQAYSPYCAYNEKRSLAVARGREPRVWSCPLVPQENRLKVPIRAGEVKFEADWIESE